MVAVLQELLGRHFGQILSTNMPVKAAAVLQALEEEHQVRRDPLPSSAALLCRRADRACSRQALLLRRAAIRSDLAHLAQRCVDELGAEAGDADSEGDGEADGDGGGGGARVLAACPVALQAAAGRAAACYDAWACVEVRAAAPWVQPQPPPPTGPMHASRPHPSRNCGAPWGWAGLSG
jgi:hypothetical protein